MKARLVGAELFHADGQKDTRIDMTKSVVTFRNFANAPRTIKTHMTSNISHLSDNNTPKCGKLHF